MRSIALAAALCGLLLTACGGSDPASSDDGPAQLAPAGAQVYVEAVVRPEGDLREGVLAAIGKVMDTDDPAGKVRELIALAEEDSDGAFDYERDVEPWLGERVGLWVDEIRPDDAAFALVIETDDPGKAVQTIRDSGAGSETEFTQKSYEGEDYYVDGDDFVFGAAGDFVVVSEAEADYKRTVDVSDEKSLGASDTYEEAIDDLPEESLATFYVDPRGLQSLFTAELDAEEAQLFSQVYDLEKIPPSATALIADGDRVAFDTVASAEAAKAIGLAGAQKPTALVGEVPADSWGAFGMADVGESAKTLIDQFAGALGSGFLQGQFEAETGLNLERDVLGWMGDVAFFVSGVGEDGLRGGAIIEATDGDKAADAFGKLIGALRTQAPRPGLVEAVEIEGAASAFEISELAEGDALIAARTDDRVLLTYGRDAAEAALGGETLSGAELWSSAESALGDDELIPSFLLDAGKVLENVEAFAGVAPELEMAEPYLDALSVLVLGWEDEDDDESQARLSLGLK